MPNDPLPATQAQPAATDSETKDDAALGHVIKKYLPYLPHALVVLLGFGWSGDHFFSRITGSQPPTGQAVLTPEFIEHISKKLDELDAKQDMMQTRLDSKDDQLTAKLNNLSSIILKTEFRSDAIFSTLTPAQQLAAKRAFAASMAAVDVHTELSGEHP